MTRIENKPRRLIHTRQITCSGYEREDGLWEIEGELTDAKTETLNGYLKQIRAGDPIHHMRLRIVVDTDMVIHDVEAVTKAGPTHECTAINDAYAKLKGLKIGPGFTGKVKALVGGIQGCTHLTNLLGSMATTAIQSMWEALEEKAAAHKADKPDLAEKQPWVINTCHAYRSHGETVKVIFPAFHKPIEKQ